MKIEERLRRKKSDKAIKTFSKYGKYTSKHLRIKNNLLENNNSITRTNTNTNTNTTKNDKF